MILLRKKIIAIALTITAITAGVAVRYNTRAVTNHEIESYAADTYDGEEDYSPYTWSFTAVKDTEAVTVDGVTYALYTVKKSTKENKTGEIYTGIAVTGISNAILDLDFTKISPPEQFLEYVSDDFFNYGKVNIITSEAFKGSNLKTINLNGVTCLMDKAFSNAAYIEDITIPESVKFVGKSTFANSGLKTLSILAPLSEIPEGMCQKTPLTGFGELNVSNLRKIGSNAFDSTALTKSLEYFAGSKYGIYVDDSAFSSCDKLTNLDIPDNIYYIGCSAFSGCSSMKKITMGKNLMCVNKTGFKDCITLQSVVFNKNLVSLGGGVFSGCTTLRDVSTLPSTLHDWIPDENDKNKGTGFGNDMFSGCTSLTSVPLPESLTKVPEGCFKGCTSLRSTSTSTNITTVGKYAYMDCENLEEVYMPKVTNIEAYAFKGCKKLSTAYINDAHIDEIGDHAFFNCELLKNLDGGKSTELKIYFKKIDNYAFANCYSFTSFIPYFETDTPVIGNNVFSLSHLKTIDYSQAINDGYHKVSVSYGTGVYEQNAELEKVILIDKSLAEMPEAMFSGCRGLKECSIDAPITIIGKEAFSQCDNLESLDVPECRIIKDSAFELCKKLNTIKVSEQLKDIGKKAFKSCSELKEIDGISVLKSPTIGDSAFESSGIKYLNIVSDNANNAVVIGNNAFKYSDLVKVDIDPDSKAEFKLGTGVFESCVKLENCTLTTNKIPAYTFKGCTSLENVYYTGDVSVGGSAFEGAGSTGTGLHLISDGKEKPVISVGDSGFKNSAVEWTYADEHTTFVGTSQYSGTDIKEVNYLKYLTTSMFEDCSNLLSVTKLQVNMIPASCFSGCTSLEEFDFSNIISIGINSFRGTGLKKVSLEHKSMTIGNYSFSECDSLTEVYASGTIGKGAFYKCNHLSKVTINADSIGDYAFASCPSLISVNFASGENSVELTEVGSNAFSDDSLIKEIYVPNNPTIGSKAFGYINNKVVSDFEIYGDVGNTTVVKYAYDNKLTYKDYDQAYVNERVEAKKRKGDVDGSGVVTIADAVKLQQYLLGQNPTGCIHINMDIDDDNKIDVFDMILMRKLIIEK